MVLMHAGVANPNIKVGGPWVGAIRWGFICIERSLLYVHTHKYSLSEFEKISTI